MSMDLEVLKQLAADLDRTRHSDEWEALAGWLVSYVDVIIATLERSKEVAEQGCEFCGAMVDDFGEERDGGREPYAHWWACGRCWNTAIKALEAAAREAEEALVWCSASQDFQMDGVAREGWLKVAKPAMEALRAVLAAAPKGSDGS